MRPPAFDALFPLRSGDPTDDPGLRREELIEDMFPDSHLPSFMPIAARRPRPSDTRGLMSRRHERKSHGR